MLGSKDGKGSDGESAGPVAWWKFDETSGNTAANAAGTKYQGKIEGQPHWAAGDSGQALEFDGLKTRVESLESSGLDFRRGLAVSARFKVRKFDHPDQTLLAKGDMWRLQRSGEKGQITFLLDGPSASTRRHGPAVTSKAAVDDGKWHQVAVSFDGKRLTMYLDGEEQESVSLSGSLTLNNLPVTIGDNDAGRGRLFNGWLDDVRLFARGLKTDEIKALCPKGR